MEVINRKHRELFLIILKKQIFPQMPTERRQFGTKLGHLGYLLPG